MTVLRFVENKETGYSQEPSAGVVELVFNQSGVCLLCGHTPGRAMAKGECCCCINCICCTKRGIVRPEES